MFGRGSLFQLLCSARTHVGREALANWMKTPASRDEVLARRGAVEELSGRRALIESVASAGTSTVSDCRPGTFRDWVAQMSACPRFPSWAPIVAFVLALVLVTLPFFYWTSHLSLQNLWVSIGGVLALEAALAAIFSKQVRSILESVHSPSAELPVICELLEIVEREQFSSPKLVALVNHLKGENPPLQTRCAALSVSFDFLRSATSRCSWQHRGASRGRLRSSMAVDRWHRDHGSDLLEWIAVLGEFEALLSLAAYAREHPQDVFPDIVESGPLFDAEGLGHPLLDESICVRNEVRLEDVRFLIVSGSNMSGKSTFLRAIGLNAVLARMGAPVRCAKLRLSPLTVAAAIRVQDSLVDGRSHFFAEMQRLRQMIDNAGEGPVLFLADEIMNGTNSHDRRIAAEWVVRALMARNAIGLVTTCDLTPGDCS